MGNQTLTGNLPGVVNDIRLRSMKILASEGVCKKLAHVITDRGDGYQVSEPVFDNSGYAATGGTEGVKISATSMLQISTTRRLYTASRYDVFTHETYESVQQASEGVRELHALAHGHGQAEKLESKILSCFNSFTTHTIAATAAAGLTWAHLAAARSKLEFQQTAPPKPYYFVGTPHVWYYYTQNTANNSSYGPVGSVADEITKKYYLSSLLGGIEVYWTPYCRTDGTATGSLVTTNATTRCALFSKQSIALWIPSDYRLEAQKEIREQGYDIVSSMRYGARVRVVGWGVRIKATGTAP